MGPQSINGTFRYIRFFDIDHPKHIKNHPCYVEELSEDQKLTIKNNKLTYIQ